jgi:hypothetical protein
VLAVSSNAAIEGRVAYLAGKAGEELTGGVGRSPFRWWLPILLRPAIIVAFSKTTYPWKPKKIAREIVRRKQRCGQAAMVM